MSKLKQSKPFSVVIPDDYKQALLDDAQKTGIHRGVFFTSSGQARCERINPTAQYNYLFRTDETKPAAMSRRDQNAELYCSISSKTAAIAQRVTN